MSRMLNEKQIGEIEALLLKKKAKIETTLNSIKNEHDGLSSMSLSDDGDFAAASRDYSIDVHIKKQQLTELSTISHCLLKINNGRYSGLCEMCDSEITIKRLRVKPNAKYCIDCRTYIDNEKKSIA